MSRIDHEVFNILHAEIKILKPVTCKQPFQDASMGPFGTFGIAILTLVDESGEIGEVPVYGSYNNILETCLLPILLHNKKEPYCQLFYRLYWSIRNEGYRGQAAALLGQVDLALHDLAARRQNLPLHTYLGATRNSVKMYGSGGGTNYSLGQLEAEVGCFLDSGADCYKMKVGKDFGTRMDEDVERVRFVKSLVGNKMQLAVDANQIWNCDQALQFLDKVGAENLAWFEEPVHSAAFDQIERLCNLTSVKISYGESERTSKTFPALVNLGVRHLQPVPTQFAGVKEWMQVRDLANQCNVDFSSGGYSLYTASLMATAHPDCRVEYLHAIMHGLEQYFSVRPVSRCGQFILPDNAGIGVRINWDYCWKEDKIIQQYAWARKNVREYSPVVSM